MTAIPTQRPAAPPTKKATPWWVYALRVLALLVVGTVAVAVLKDNVPSPSAIWHALRGANGWWIAAAFAFQLLSIGMMIRQQRRLLHAFGVPVSLGRVGAITYSSTALSMSMPAGGAVGAGWSYRQYRASGASAATATTVLLLSGVLSVVGLVLLFLAGLGISAGGRLFGVAADNPILVLLVGAGVIGLIVLITVLLPRTDRRPDTDHPPATPRLDEYQDRHPRLGAAFRQVLSTGRRAGRVHPRDWRLTLMTSAANWALDICCLYAACLAFGVHIGLWEIGAIYLGIQLVRQIPLTPGGIGLVEVSLLAALVAAHVPEAPASAAVLIYRLFAAWLIIPIGFVMLAFLRRRSPVTADASLPDAPSRRA